MHLKIRGWFSTFKSKFRCNRYIIVNAWHFDKDGYLIGITVPTHIEGLHEK